jgi:hypothetical protein
MYNDVGKIILSKVWQSAEKVPSAAELASDAAAVLSLTSARQSRFSAPY